MGELTALLAAMVVGGLLVWMILAMNNPADRPVPRRRCPLCGSELGPNETVFAQLITSTPPQQLKIKGCPHCLPNYHGETLPLEPQ